MSNRCLLIVAIGAVVAVGRSSSGADFVRGDGNGDGEVTAADAIYILTRVTEGTISDCADAMDTDDNGEVNNLDGRLALIHAIQPSDIPAPYPTAGPDPTEDELDCPSAESLPPLDDPAAELAIQDVQVSGAEDREVVIQLNLSSSVRVGAYVAELEVPEALTFLSRKDLSGRLLGGSIKVYDSPGRVQIAFLPNTEAIQMIPPREDAPVTEVRMCLAPGTPAGSYPLTLIRSEFASESGRPIQPSLVSATLTVDEDVEDVACPLPPKIVDFVRGDANRDGVVTVSDIFVNLRFQFVEAFQGICGDALDVNDDGQLEITDAIDIFRYLIGIGPDPAAPFPSPGSDPTEDENPFNDERFPCTEASDDTPLEDDSASIRILDTVVPGGTDRAAELRLALASSRRVGGYAARISTSDTILEEADLPQVGVGLTDLSGTFTAGIAGVRADPSGNHISLAFLPSVVANVAILPQSEQPVLEFHLCLRPGTPAGDYPLSLLSGELVDAETGRRIEPELLSGTLTILEDVVDSDCSIEEIEVSEPVNALQVEYRLEDSVGAPGQEVLVPIRVRASDHAISHGVQISVTYVPEYVDLLGVEELLPRPDGEPWAFRREYVDSEAGTVTGRFSYSRYYLEDFALPSEEEFTALGLRFRVSEDVPIGTEIPIDFQDGNPFCFSSGRCYPYENAIISGQWALPASQIDSLILVGGNLKIIGEVSIFSRFVRGDANSDGQVDISDPIFTLGFVYLGTEPPECEDAADANDDGIIDLSDAIATLTALFVTGESLPRPAGAPGSDPTPDTLGCGDA